MEKRKVWKIASRVLTWILIGITIAMLAFTILTLIMGKGNTSLFGFRAYTVLSNSMAENNDITFDAGDMIISKEVDPSTLVEGDIISFVCMDPNNDAYGEVITHKIKTKYVSDGVPYFTTYGTTTGTEDAQPVAYNFVMGVYKFKIPQLGNFVQWMKTPLGYVLVVGIPFLILIGFQLVACIRAWRAYKATKDGEANAEREQLAAERAETLQMMEELQRMRAELAAVQQMQQQSASSSTTQENIDKTDASPATPATEAPTTEAPAAEQTPPPDNTNSEESPAVDINNEDKKE